MLRLLPLVALLLLAPALRAQADAAADDEAAVLAAVHELWEAMRTADSTRARAVLHPEARGYTVGMRGEQVILMQGTPEDFITAIGTPHDAVWDERVANEEVRLDGPLATYYADYEFWLGDTRSHCGVDAFQLMKTGSGWQIFVLTDTRRACE